MGMKDGRKFYIEGVLNQYFRNLLRITNCENEAMEAAIIKYKKAAIIER